MEFNHLHLYVDDVAHWCNQFVRRWGGQTLPLDSASQGHNALIYLGQVPLLITAPQKPGDAASTYLQQHPPGIGDIAFRVKDLDPVLQRLIEGGGKILAPMTVDPHGRGRWCTVQGWGALRHSLVQSHQKERWVPGQAAASRLAPTAFPQPWMTGIDHAVLNVPAGQLTAAIHWYERQLGLQPKQQFTIDTPWSGLRSQVLAAPAGGVQLPINEPTTPNSQVQEFLDCNGGAGIQHVALHTPDILQTVQRLREAGVAFLEVPNDYYSALAQRPGYLANAARDQAIARQQVLVDWEAAQPQARLLQTFTQPFLSIPTFFFELIQRQVAWSEEGAVMARGFGERNFQALFEAMEQEQRKRGSLVPGAEEISTQARFHPGQITDAN